MIRKYVIFFFRFPRFCNLKTFFFYTFLLFAIFLYVLFLPNPFSHFFISVASSLSHRQNFFLSPWCCFLDSYFEFQAQNIFLHAWNVHRYSPRDNPLLMLLRRLVRDISSFAFSDASSCPVATSPEASKSKSVTLPTVEEGPFLACASLSPLSLGHYCSTQHLHLGFFFSVTCSTCDASPGPCAVILATSTVAVLDAPTWK